MAGAIGGNMFGLMRKRKHEKKMAAMQGAMEAARSRIRLLEATQSSLAKDLAKIDELYAAKKAECSKMQAKYDKKLNREVKNRDAVAVIAERDDRINALMKDNYKLREDRRKLNADLERIKANMPSEVYRGMFETREPESVRIAHYGPPGNGKTRT